MSTGQRDIPYHMTSSGRRFNEGGSSSHSLPLLAHCLGGAEPLLLHHFLHTFINIYVCVCVCVHPLLLSFPLPLERDFSQHMSSTFFFFPHSSLPHPTGKGAVSKGRCGAEHPPASTTRRPRGNGSRREVHCGHLEMNVVLTYKSTLFHFPENNLCCQ